MRRALTTTQLAVLQMVSRGLTFKQIAKERDRSEDTCKDIMDGVRRKLGAPNKMVAVVTAIREGIL